MNSDPHIHGTPPADDARRQNDQDELRQQDAGEFPRIDAALEVETEERNRAEEAWRKSEDFLRVAIDTIPILAWTTLPDGRIEYLNKRWLDYTGLKLEQAQDWGWQIAIHPADLSGLIEYWKSILAAGTEGEYEARLQRYDGVYRWFLFRAVPLYDNSGALLGWYGTNTDIEALRTSEHLARGQMESLTRTLTALSRESEPEKFLEHVLLTIGERLGAHSIGVWEMNASTGRVELVANCEDERLHLASRDVQHASPNVMLARRKHPVWTEFFRSGKYCVLGEIEGDQCRVRIMDGKDSPWYDWSSDEVADPNVPSMLSRLAEAGVASTLSVPMFVAGKVTGFLSIRFRERRVFVCEEIELTRALAHQAMLAIQLMRLSQDSREAAVAAERNRMARDIHDTLAQGFTGVIVQLEAAEEALSRNFPEKAMGYIGRAGELARESLHEARRSVSALRPHALEQRDLCEALPCLMQKMTAGTGLEVSFTVDGDRREIPPDWEDNLLRIGQEVLTNALRHAQASEFKVRLVFALHEIRLEMRDNGRGFDPARRHDGFGLQGMRERVESMGGHFLIDSERDRGTAISITLPLPTAAKSSKP